MWKGTGTIKHLLLCSQASSASLAAKAGAMQPSIDPKATLTCKFSGAMTQIGILVIEV